PTLEARTGLCHIQTLGFAGNAAEDRIAMREAAEARDHLAMALGKVEEFLERLPIRCRRDIAQPGESRHGQVLDVQVLGMFQHQIDEYAADGYELCITALGQAVLYQPQRRGIAGERSGRAAMDHP